MVRQDVGRSMAVVRDADRFGGEGSLTPHGNPTAFLTKQGSYPLQRRSESPLRSLRVYTRASPLGRFVDQLTRLRPLVVGHRGQSVLIAF